jgi:cytochrome c-type biogenesis protein CcmE
VSTRSPARLVVALGVAGVLAVFLLYTAVVGNSSIPTYTPSQLAGHAGKLSVVGVVVGPLRGDSHAPGGLRFGLHDINGRSRTIQVVYRGDSPPPLFRVGRNVVATGLYEHGRLQGSDLLTKCPSKYTAKTSA